MLDVYTNGDNDQPTTCPKCGRRTEWEELPDQQQLHKCACDYWFIMDFYADPEEQPGCGEPFEILTAESGYEPEGKTITVYADDEGTLWYDDEEGGKMKAPLASWRRIGTTEWQPVACIACGDSSEYWKCDTCEEDEQ